MDYVNRTKAKQAFDIVAILAWLGAMLMVLFSFTLFVPFALIGLALLTVQAYKANLKNLVCLNILSISGFLLGYFL